MIRQTTPDTMISTSDCVANNDKDKDGNISWCESCDNKLADIFQVEGNYCLDCWQKRTHPNP
jgi:hypothetical protein